MTGDERHTALQEHIAGLRAGSPPLPLSRAEAIEQAARLRVVGLSFADVGRVMAEYHGQYYAAKYWWNLVHDAGLPTRRGER
jgi:hypothetical protein